MNAYKGLRYLLAALALSLLWSQPAQAQCLRCLVGADERMVVTGGSSKLRW
jgi:hypothetical protein